MINQKPLKNMSGSLDDAAHTARTYNPDPTEIKDSKGNPFSFYNVGKTDYPELEGKIIRYDRGMPDPDIVTVLVVGCNTNVGITLVEAADKDHYLACFTGPSAPGGSNCTDFDQGIWEYLIKGIQRGLVEAREIHNFDNSCLGGGSGPDGSQCAYRQ